MPAGEGSGGGLAGTEAAPQPEHPLQALPAFQPSSSETKQAAEVEKGKKRKTGAGKQYYIPN